jgi:hypothetical protein
VAFDGPLWLWVTLFVVGVSAAVSSFLFRR